MSSLITMPSNTLDLAIQLVMGMRVELTVFLIAIGIHSILFGKYKLTQTSKNEDAKGQKVDSRDLSMSTMEPRRTTKLVKCIEKLMAAKIDSGDLAAAILDKLEHCPDTEVPNELAHMLQQLGYQANMDLLDAVRQVLTRRSVKMTALLGKWLLQGYFRLRQMKEFNNLLEVLEKSALKDNENIQQMDGINMVAVKAALWSSDWAKAIMHFSRLSAMWTSHTASSAPNSILRQLVQLAVRKKAVPDLVKELMKLQLPDEARDFILSECALLGDAATWQHVEEMEGTNGLQFSSTTFASLISGFNTVEDAQRLFKKAVDRGVASNEILLLAVIEIATVHRSSSVANTLVNAIFAQLPAVTAQPKVACALLRFYGGLPCRKSKVDSVSSNLKETQCIRSPDNSSPIVADATWNRRMLSEAKCATLLEIYEQRCPCVDLRSDCQVENLMVEAALTTGKIKVLEKLVQQMPKDGARQMSLIKSFSAEKRLKDAYTIFDSCTTKNPGLYNALMDACVEYRDTKAVEDIMHQAKEAGMADVVTYNTLMKAYICTRNFEKAKDVMSLMHAAGQQPNRVSFHQLLDASLTHCPDAVWSILGEMQACGYQPSQITCSILLKATQSNSRNSNLDRTMKVIDSMEEEMDEVLLGSILEACVREGRDDLLMPRLRRQKSPKKIHIKGAHTYGSLIRAFGFVHDLDGIWHTWREMRTRQIKPPSITIGCMVEAVVSNGDPEGGLEFIHDVQADPDTSNFVNAVIYCSVLKGFSHQKKFDRLWSVYKEMLALKMDFSVITYNTLIDACARNGQMSCVPTLLEDMAHLGIQPNLISYSAILKGYCQDNRLDMAFDILGTMKQSKQVAPDEIVFNCLLDGCARQGLFERGLAVLKEMEEAGIYPSNFTLSVLVKLANRARKLEAAFDLCDQISSKYKFKVNVHVYNNLIQACIAHQARPRAFSVFLSMLDEKVQPDVRSYTLLINAYNTAGQYGDAAGLLRAALGLSEVHSSLDGFNRLALQPKGGLPKAMVSASLEGICQGGDESLLRQLMQDVRRQCPDFSIDPKVHFLLAKRMQGVK